MRVMTTNRIEAFSDGVIAIIVTIMVLEMKQPADASAAALLHEWPTFVSYAMSFFVVAIIWVNHHHIMHTAKIADAPLLWANNHLLFWMSLIPFVTAYAGRNWQVPLAVACYGAVLMMCALGFIIVRYAIARHHRENKVLSAIHRRTQWKNLFSTLLYGSTVPLAFVDVRFSFAIFVLIPVMYFIPERKLEQCD